MSNEWQWIIGGCLLLFYTHKRFNDPHTNRSSTTFVRYYTAYISYLLALIFLYALLGGGITNAPEIYAFLTRGGSQVNDIQNLPGPLLASLLLTVLLPNFPLLSQTDERVRKFFQEIGSIPWAARNLSASLRKSVYTVPSGLYNDVRAELRDFPESIFDSTPNDSLQHKWISIVSLYLQVKAWGDTKKYNRFTELHRSDLRSIEKYFTKLIPKVLSCYTLTRQRSNNDDENFEKAVSQCEKDTADHLDELFKLLCDFIARGVLHNEMTQRERENQLELIGFSEIPEDIKPLDINQIVNISFIIFIIMLAGMLVMGRSLNNTPRVLFISAMVSIIYGAALVAAIYPKIRWDFANIKNSKHRPSLSYFLTGLIAFIFALLISLVFKFLYYGEFLKSLIEIRWTFPWFFLSTTLSILVAYLIDDYALKEDSEPKWLRWWEGIVGASIMGSTAWLVHKLLLQVPKLPEEFRLRVPPEPAVITIAATVGLVVCLLVPHWFRSKTEEIGGGGDRASRRNL